MIGRSIFCIYDLQDDQRAFLFVCVGVRAGIFFLAMASLANPQQHHRYLTVPPYNFNVQALLMVSSFGSSLSEPS